jgi:hypothetical protein
MDYDSGIVTALLRDGEPAYKQLLDSGVAPTWVYPPWRQVLSSILSFRKQHGALPSQQAVEQINPTVKFNGTVSDPFIFFVDEVKKRHIYNIVNDGVKAQADKLDKLDPLGALKELESVLLRVRKERVISSTITPLDDMIDLILKEYDERKAGKMGVPTAWKSIDEMTGGLANDDLAVWVAPTGLGKTWTMILNARAAMRAGHKVLFVSTEMSMLRIAMRYIAVDLKLPFQELRKGQLTAFAETRMRGDLQALKGTLTNFLLVGGNFKIDMRVIESAVEEAQPTIIFVDGAYLVHNRGENRFDMLANTVNDMKSLAVARQIPVVISTQFNRQQKHKAAEASLENVALAYALTWDADWVFALVQTKDMKLGNRMKIATLKARDAEPIFLEINWDLRNQDFSEIPSTTSSGQPAGQASAAAAPGAPPTVDTDFNEIPL